MVLGNSIFRNGGLAIDLGGIGLDGNDLGDGDGGPNNLQNKPTLTRADVSGISYEEGLMTMAIVIARYPQLERRARTMSTAILLGQARKRAGLRTWRGAGRTSQSRHGTPARSGPARDLSLGA